MKRQAWGMWLAVLVIVGLVAAGLLGGARWPLWVAAGVALGVAANLLAARFPRARLLFRALLIAGWAAILCYSLLR